MASLEYLPDEKLIAACQAGENDAWHTLVQRYSRLVYTIPARYGLTRTEIDDVYQTVWMNLLKHLPHLNRPDRVAAWLVTTARRECWERRRRADYTHTVSVDPTEIAAESWVELMSTEEIVNRYEQHQAMRNALEQLGKFCRHLLQLLYYDPQKPAYTDIATTLNIPIGSIGPKRARCLQKLRQLMLD
ncbi:MAG: sigma-70 family RNA polymerase sigma factor [Ardenticatenales bacterium]|nr:sigma-70 family RNA polymerase sigma factor [Ardenticatenales bacterium]